MCLLLGFYGYKVTTFCDNNKKKVKKNKIDIRMINESVDKIINFKKKYEINDEKAKGIDIDKINSEIDNLHKIKI